ncbi:MAG: hypothetical protein JXR40_03925 [Pontiellaceae bacterium]|nr:hypothetical protein [Pontiellaceae bacterium]
MIKSWKTTAAAILGLLSIVFSQVGAAIDGNPATVANWNTVTPALVACVGLFFAKDSDEADNKPA